MSSLMRNRATDAVSLTRFAIDPNDIGKAVNRALASGETWITIPRGNYVCQTPFNATNRAIQPLILEGAGSYYGASGGVSIQFKTGTWMADFTGCQFSELRNMRWLADGSAGSSTLGILYARSTVVGYAMFNRQRAMMIELESSAGNATLGSVALANNCAENFLADHCWYLADTPMAISLGNEWSFASVDATLANTTFSATDMSFRQCVMLSRNGYPVALSGAAGVTFDSCDAQWSGTGSIAPAAMLLQASADGYQKCANIRWNGGDMEGFAHMAYITGAAKGIEIVSDTSGITADSVLIYAGTTVDGLKVRNNNLSGPEQNQIAASGPGVVVNNVDLQLQSGQKQTDTNVLFQGGTINAGNNDVHSTALVNLHANSTATLTGATTGGRGQTAWNPGGVATGATVAAPATIAVTGAAVGDYVSVAPPYSLQGCNAWGVVTSAGQVQLYVSNSTGSTVTLANGTWRVKVEAL